MCSHYALEDVILLVCQSAVWSPSFRVNGPLEGYRCKATYSLFPNFVSSPLTVSSVNTICAAVSSFRQEQSSFTVMYPKFFFEVCGKITRCGEFMLKIVFQDEPLVSEDHEGRDNSCTTLFDKWRSSGEDAKLVQFLLKCFPTLVAVIAHVGMGHKAGKSDRYIPLLNQTTHITELTPNGVPYLLSADSFCEVNSVMEDAMYEATLKFLHLCECHRRRIALLSGRDVNSVYKTFTHFYESVTPVTSCPRVYADTRHNGIADCIHIPKSELHHTLRVFGNMEVPQGVERHVIITAGRNGLNPSASTTLVELARSGKVDDLLYVSCNVVSLSRDVRILSTGFEVKELRTFDFFPGTKYVMTILHLKPLLVTSSGKSVGLLLMPVGPPGIGKTTLGNHLQQFFQPRGKENHLCTNRFEFHHVERDAVFKSKKDIGWSLKKTRQHTHDVLLDALTQEKAGNHESPRDVLYVDSTNGSLEARRLYQSMWKGTSLVLRLGGLSETELLQRTKRREGHPSFPSDQDAQLEKINTILNFMKSEDMDSSTMVHSEQSVYIDCTCTEAESCHLVCVHIVCYLIFTQPLAEKIAMEPMKEMNFT